MDPKRLDVSILVSIVGKEKIRREIDKDFWYVQFIDETGDDMLDITIFEKFNAEYLSGPLEYLIFNNKKFVYFIFEHLDLCLQLTASYYKGENIENFTEEEIADIARENFLEYIQNNDVPKEIQQGIWKEISQMAWREFNYWFSPIYYRHFYLFDHNLQQVLPIKNQELSKSYWEQWKGKQQ